MLPASVWRILLFSVFALTAGIGVVRLAQGTHVETYPGTLTARIVPVTTERAGVISEWLVLEGAAVRIGQPLVAMADPSIDRRRLELEADVTRLQAELERALAQADLELDWRIKEINETIFTARLRSADYLEEQHVHEMEEVALADLLDKDSTALWTQPDTVIDSLVLQESETPDSRLNMVLRLEAATIASEVCTAQVELCDQQVDWLEELKGMLPARVRKSLGVDIAQRNLEDAQAQRADLDEAASRAVTISSPAIGRAGVYCKRVGDYAAVGEPLVEVLDDSRRFVLIEVPSEKVSEFTVGRELTILFSGDLKRTGRVSRVAPQAVPRAADGTGAAVVQVHIEQAGIVWPSVPIGARVEASL